MGAKSIAFKPKPCPAEGEGVHNWVCYAAFRAVEAGLTDEQAKEEIEASITRDPKPNEIEDALAYARGGKHRASPAWPKVNHEQVEAITLSGPRLADLWKSSPERMAITNFNRAELIIRSLFPSPDTLLC